MPNNGESGHASKVTNLNELISFINSYGEAYNPSYEPITPAALNELAAVAANSMAVVNGALPDYNAAASARKLQFAPVSKLVTRILNTLRASGVSKPAMTPVYAIARKVRGNRAATSGEPAAKTTEGEPAPAPRHISVSQMSFDNRAENFGKLVMLLTGIPQYNPNEPELKIAALTELAAILKSTNTTVIETAVTLSNARINRDVILYRNTTGVCDIALAVKNYVKAAFGASSPQYKQISRLRFRKVKCGDLSNHITTSQPVQPPQPD